MAFELRKFARPVEHADAAISEMEASMKHVGLALLVCFATHPSFAQQVPFGGQFQVNTTTYHFQEHSAVARDDQGNFVVVWLDDNTPTWIAGQRFSADGTPAGGEFQVNTLLGDEVAKPEVAMAGDGRFVVVWYDNGGLDGSSYSVRGQRYAAAGTPVGTEMQVNSYTNGPQGWPSVAIRDDGSFVVVWIGEGTHDSNGVHGQAFGWDGLSLWGEFGINDYLIDDVHYPDVAIADNGQFVVVWASVGSPGNDTSGQSIQAKCLPWGSAVPPPQQQVNTYTGGDQYQSAVAVAPDGSFLVTYNLHYTLGVGAQRFLADCSPIGDEFLVNSTPAEFYWPDVAVDDQGRYIVVFLYGEIYGRLFDPSGIPFDDEFWVPSHDFFGLGHPKVDSSPDGQFVVTWHSFGSTGDDDDQYSIQARRFAGLVGIFVDGFESGDTTAWTDTSP